MGQPIQECRNIHCECCLHGRPSIISRRLSYCKHLPNIRPAQLTPGSVSSTQRYCVRRHCTIESLTYISRCPMADFRLKFSFALLTIVSWQRLSCKCYLCEPGPGRHACTCTSTAALQIPATVIFGCNQEQLQLNTVSCRGSALHGQRDLVYGGHVKQQKLSKELKNSAPICQKYQ